MLTRRKFLGGAGACLSACATPQIVPGTTTPEAVMNLAERYRLHHWTPTAANVFHGEDPSGVRVDTPDIGYRPPGGRPGWWKSGAVNVGVPYQWGGFDTPESFDRKVAAGFAAGDVYTPLKRKLLEEGVGRQACGIDCSGFISRCWGLPRPYSTRELEGLCQPLDAFSRLQAGDALNKHNAHVLLFERWLNAAKTEFVAYETGSEPAWKVLRHAIRLDFVAGKGYRPLRYPKIGR